MMEKEGSQYQQAAHQIAVCRADGFCMLTGRVTRMEFLASSC